MKSIIKFFAIIMILSLIACSLRRKSKTSRKSSSKTKSKTTAGEYEGSELDIMVGKISQKMCLKVGREATYVFFGSITNYINKTLPDRVLYDKLFTTARDNTFTEYMESGQDLNLLQGKMMTTVMARLGGNTPAQIPKYWAEYAKKMQRDNQAYLEGLCNAAVGRSDKHKLYNDVADTANKFAQNGLQGGIHELAADKLSVNGVASMVTEKVIEITIWLIQRKMLNDANSNFFKDDEKKEKCI